MQNKTLKQYFSLRGLLARRLKRILRKWLIWNPIYKWQIINFPMPDIKGHFVEIKLFNKKIFKFEISVNKVTWLEDKFDLELF